ncbi:MAG: ATP-binding cassette domain-containing protein, partial [Treponema sp.]|nr:ATP-binding cassette domain-containing protein [Treponema sp.]
MNGITEGHMDDGGAKVAVKNLRQYFPVSAGFARKKLLVKAVDDVSFSIRAGEVLGLVGESGCGKTTLGKTLLHLIPPSGGDVFFDGRSLGAMKKEELRLQRLKMQIVFQDPYGSLNARMSVGALLQEPLLYHRLCSGRDSREKVEELLSLVGLRPFHAHRYPHEYSGGQRQHIAIARALAVNTEFIVCDEPVSALDVSVQSQILNLFSDLRERLNLTYLFISHDLSVVRHI